MLRKHLVGLGLVVFYDEKDIEVLLGDLTEGQEILLCLGFGAGSAAGPVRSRAAVMVVEDAALPRRDQLMLSQHLASDRLNDHDHLLGGGDGHRVWPISRHGTE
jgi:hypothetical protein